MRKGRVAVPRWKSVLRLLGFSALFVAILGFSALGVYGLVTRLAAASHHAQPPASGTAAAPSTITVAVPGDIPTLDPARAADTESISAVQMLYEGLFSYGPGGQLVGRLAQTWNWNDGNTRLTVQLNPRARFADGSDVTAQDVVFSLDRMLNAQTGAPEAQSFSALEGYAQLRAGQTAPGIAADGADTVVFTLTQPLPTLPELLALPSASIVEKALASQSGAASAQWWFQNSAGSGPYVLGSFSPGISLRLKPAPHYWRAGQPVGDGGTEGPFAAVTFQVVSSPSQQLQLFKAGKLDVLDPLGPAQEKALGAMPPGSRLLAAPALGLSYLGFNNAKAPFNNLDVRMAAAYALDQNAILAAAGGQGQVAGGILPPGVAGRDSALRPVPYNPQRSSALLAQSGLQMPIPVVLLTIASSGTVQAQNDAVVNLVAKELDAVGFSVTLRAESWQSYYQDLADGSDNLFQATWIADYPSAQDFFFNLLDSASIGGNNASFFADPAFDQLDAEAAATVNANARHQLYGELEQKAYQELPLVPEFYTENTALVRGNLAPANVATFLTPPLMPQYDQVRVQTSG